MTIIEPKSLPELKAFLCSIFPSLTIDNISVLGEGWDSTALLVDDCLVFRIPKHPTASQQMAKEVRVLEAIRPYVSAQVPNVEWVGRVRGHSLVFAMGYRKLIGAPLSDAPMRSTIDYLLQMVGRFLVELHTVPQSVLHQADAPWFRWTGDNSFHGPDSWETGLRGFTDRIMQDVVPLLSESVGKAITEFIEAFVGHPGHFQFQPVLLHGDLVPEHILFNADTAEISIIDFGDCGIGDPAYDVWPELTSFYHGPVDDSFAKR